MSNTTMTVRLPEGVAREVERLAREGGVTAEQFLASAAAEKVSAIASAADYFSERGKHADWTAFEEVFGVRSERGEPPQPGDEAD
jgi:hypothetical protein